MIARDGNRIAVGDINATNHSDLVPMHAVRVPPGVVSVDLDCRRLATEANSPTLIVTDANGKHFGYFYAWDCTSDIVALELPDHRGIYTNNEHALGDFSAPGKWFGLKIDDIRLMQLSH